MGNWAHFQKLDYEQLPFKCRGCHEYGHFMLNYPKKSEIQHDKTEGWHKVNRSKPKNQVGVDLKKGKGNKEARAITKERTQATSLTKETIEIRDDPNEAKEKSSNENSKDFEPAPSDQAKEQEEGTPMTKEEERREKNEEESETEEEEEEEGEIELTTPRLTKTKGRKSKKEEREQATYKDKLQGSQLTLEKLLKNIKNTR